MKYGCPKGHTEGIQESYHCHVWLPVDLTTGEIPEDTYGKEEFDNESFESDGRYWCPTCGNTFPDLIEIEVPDHA